MSVCGSEDHCEHGHTACGHVYDFPPGLTPSDIQMAMSDFLLGCGASCPGCIVHYSFHLASYWEAVRN